SGADQYTLSLTGGSTVQIVEKLGAASPVTYTVALATLGANLLTFSPSVDDDLLTVDYSGGTPFGAGGVSYNGGTQVTSSPGDKLAIIGAAGTDTATFTASTATLNGAAAIGYSNVETVTYNGQAGFDTVNVNGGIV